MRPKTLIIAGLSALMIVATFGAAALAQGDTRLPQSTRSEQRMRELNRDMSQQMQFQQQNQAIQWQLDQQRMRQQIDIPQLRGGGSPGCPPGAIGC